jgi:trehalose 6-phosphate synthase
MQGKGHVLAAQIASREVRFGAFPISIDFNQFMRQAASSEVADKAQELHRLLPQRKLILGIDRLDFTKGIPHKLKAFHDLLSRYPRMQEKISLIQVVVPSRVGIPEYDGLRTTIEQLVGHINGQFMRPYKPSGGPAAFSGELLAHYRR